MRSQKGLEIVPVKDEGLGWLESHDRGRAGATVEEGKVAKEVAWTEERHDRFLAVWSS